MTSNLEITNLVTPILNSLKLASDEVKSLLDYGISEYIQNQTDKYYYTNTFLHRSEKVRFNDVYFPITTNYNHLFTKFENIENVLDEYKFITIIGSAGSGKSTLIKHIFLNSIKQAYKIPVFIELRHLNDFGGSLIDYVKVKLLNNEVKPSQNTLNRALSKGVFLFLLDGYDEIFSKNKQLITREIEDFTDKYSKNKFIITTRPGGGIEGIPRFHSFVVQDLEENEIPKFLDLLVKNKERKKQIFNNINKSESLDYIDYLKNPLLLSMFILAFESHPEIPNRKSAFYKNVFDTLYSKHDGITKNSFPREKKTLLKREDFEEILSVFSFSTISEGKYSFTEEYLSDKLRFVNSYKDLKDIEIQDLIFDFRTSISIMIKDGFEYSFPHRSMQEYFASLFISRLPSNKKSKAYKRLIKIFNESSADNSLNIWKLCKEMDNTNYLKFFVLPVLKDARNKLENKSDRLLLASFYKLWEPILFMPTDNEQSELFLARKYNLFGTVMDYEQIYDYQEFCYFPESNSSKKEIISFLESNYNNPIDEILDIENKIHSHPKVMDILINNGICDVINCYASQIKERINVINNNLENENDFLEDLLDI